MLANLWDVNMQQQQQKTVWKKNEIYVLQMEQEIFERNK